MATNTKTSAKFDGRSIYITAGSVRCLDALAKSMGYDDHTIFTCFQGGWVGPSSFSGNTHGREAVDLSEADWRTKVWNARRLGFWLDHRTVADGGGSWKEAHCHGARIGSYADSVGPNRWLDPSMYGQQREYVAGGDGLLGNRPDDDRRPRYPDVRFVDDMVHERWIATKPIQGYDQAGGHSGDKLGPARPKGYVTGGENIATVKVNGVEWLVFASMTFFRKSDFNVYVPGFVKKTEKWVMAPSPASATIYGRVAAGPDAGKKSGSVYANATGHPFTSVGYRIVGGIKYVTTANGTWFTATSLKPAPATPTKPPAVAKSINVTLASQNVIARRLSPSQPAGIGDWHKGETYAKRVSILAPALKAAEVVATQEAGNSTMAGQFDNALTKATGRPYDHYRAGDNFQGGDITQTVTYAADRFKRAAAGEVQFSPSGPGSSHDSAPWVRLEDMDTGIAFGVVSLHLLAGSGAANAKLRGQQVANLVPTVRAIPELVGLPVIYVGDHNQARETDGDPVGKAYAALGLTDVEATSCAGVNVDYDSYNGLKTIPPRHSRQLDRAFIDLKQVTPRRRTVLVTLKSGKYPTPFGSDHQGVEFEFTIYRA